MKIDSKTEFFARTCRIDSALLASQNFLNRIGDAMRLPSRVVLLVVFVFGQPQLVNGQYEEGDVAIADSFNGVGIINSQFSTFTPMFGNFPPGTLGNPGKIDVKSGVSFVTSLDDVFRFAVVGDVGEFIADTEGGIGAILFDNQGDGLIVCTASNLTWYDVTTGQVIEVFSDGLIAPQDILQMPSGEILIIDILHGLLRLDNDRNLTTVTDKFTFRSLDQMTLGQDGFLYISQEQNFPLVDYSLFRMDLKTGNTVEVEVLQLDRINDLATDNDGNILIAGQKFANDGGEGVISCFDPTTGLIGTMIEQTLFRPEGIVVVDDPGPLLGDANMDGRFDLLDVDPFVTTISISQFCVNSDINRDGVVNLLDVVPFVFLLQLMLN